MPVWVLIWDNASWHVSKAVRAWIRAHNHAVKQQGCGRPSPGVPAALKSPWLNPIEPKWVHGKRAIVEPARLLSAQEVADRVCAYHGCPHEPHLSLPDTVVDDALGDPSQRAGANLSRPSGHPPLGGEGLRRVKQRRPRKTRVDDQRSGHPLFTMVFAQSARYLLAVGVTVDAGVVDDGVVGDALPAGTQATSALRAPNIASISA